MKKLLMILLSVAIGLCPFLSACAVNGDIPEEMFYRKWDNISKYPQSYMDVEINYNCFTYKITDIYGNEYICGVRHCSFAPGCKCGNDTICGFVLEYDGIIPEPRNQSEQSVEKTWVHIVGRLASTTTKGIEIYAYNNGVIDYNAPHEKLIFLTLIVSEINIIENYQNLNYYVDK